jgi:hypothetical protein
VNGYLSLNKIQTCFDPFFQSSIFSQRHLTSNYAMDPLTAVGLAGNIVQFVEVASRILSAARKLHNSAHGIAIGNEESEVLALNLRDLAEVENLRQLDE